MNYNPYSFSGQVKWITLFGERLFVDNIQRLNTKGQRTVLRKAMGKAAAIVAKSARAKAPVRNGYLKKAIKSKVTRLITGRVYVDPKFVVAVGEDGHRIVKFKGNAKRQAQLKAGFLRHAERTGQKVIIPAKYAHLVEYGTRHSAAKPFMRPAVNENKAAVIKTIEDEFKVGFEKYLKQFGK